MFVPGLPSDRLAKMIFFGGLAITVTSYILLFTGDSSLDEYKAENNIKVQEVRAKIALDELAINHFTDSAKNVSAQKPYQLARLEQIKINHEAERDVLLKNLSDKIFTARLNETFYWVFLGIGVFLLFTGLVLWIMSETEEDRINEYRRNKELGTLPCQSCGMQLRHDYKPYMEQEYCSHCFNGTGFTETLSLQQMQDRVKKQMQAQGLKGTAIRRQLKKNHQA